MRAGRNSQPAGEQPPEARGQREGVGHQAAGGGQEAAREGAGTCVGVGGERLAAVKAKGSRQLLCKSKAHAESACCPTRPLSCCCPLLCVRVPLPHALHLHLCPHACVYGSVQEGGLSAGQCSFRAQQVLSISYSFLVHVCVLALCVQLVLLLNMSISPWRCQVLRWGPCTKWCD